MIFESFGVFLMFTPYPTLTDIIRLVYYICSYPKQRQEISEFISSVVPNNLLAIAADAHMVAFDDGSNTYFGSNTTAKSFPILQTAPLDRHGSFKGGLYSDGCKAHFFDRNHQYSVIEFLGDTSDSPCLKLVSYRLTRRGKKEEIFSKTICGDVFTKSNPGAGSCDATYFSVPSLALLIVSGLLLAVSLVQTFFLGYAIWKACSISFLVIIVYGLTLLMGWAIPSRRGISQFDTFEILLVGTVQLSCCTVYLSFWIRSVRFSAKTET
jgi:hypothetical protein